MRETFNWHHPAIQNYIAECKDLRSYWKFMTRVNFNKEERYETALNNVRRYLDSVGIFMPRVLYEDKKVERLIYR